ncbi:MAG: hypothetical protein ACKVS6_06590 [Planctomycetota bacterium]
MNPRTSLLAAILVGTLLRILSFTANVGFPHGDVLLDAATAESLASGRGFWTPWEEGTSLRPDEIGLTNETFGHPADQHGPLCPLLAAPFVWLTKGDGVLALQIVSFLIGILTIPLAWKVFSRFGERAGIWTAWTCALLLPLCDYSGNGSLYSAQVAGLFLLPAVGQQLATAKQALGAGAILGLLFLLNYQCAVLIPAFAIAVFFTFGFAGSVAPLVYAALACLCITMPWFLRNFVIFGNVIYTTNLDYVVHHLGKHTIELNGERPLTLSVATPSDFMNGFKSWTGKNFCYWITAIHLAIPLLTFFVPGGFARILQKRPDGQRDFAGAFLTFAFVALFIITIVWPAPKARYAVPLAAIIAGVAMVELVNGARWLWAVGTVLLTIAAAWWSGLGLVFAPLVPWALITVSPAGSGFPNLESSYLLFTLTIPFLAILPAVRRLLPAIALAIIILHGAFRVAISLDKEFSASAFHVSIEGKSMFGPPTATFYDVIQGPFSEGNEILELVDLRRAAKLLKETGAKRIIAPLSIYYYWDGELVTLPSFAKRFDLGVLPKTLDTFRCDAVVVPIEFQRDPEVWDRVVKWAFQMRAEQIFGPPEAKRFIALRFPSPP